jgi:hypothetical protein
VTHHVKVYPGPEGKIKFQNDVRRLLGLRSDQTFNVNFECQPPGEEGRLELPGIDAFEAARFCASVTAGVRAMERAQSRQDQGTDPIDVDDLYDSMPFSPSRNRVIERYTVDSISPSPPAVFSTPRHPQLRSNDEGQERLRSAMVTPTARPAAGTSSELGSSYGSSSTPVSPSAVNLAHDIAQRSKRHYMARSQMSRMGSGRDQDFIESSLLLTRRASGMMDNDQSMGDEEDEEEAGEA